MVRCVTCFGPESFDDDDDDDDAGGADAGPRANPAVCCDRCANSLHVGHDLKTIKGDTSAFICGGSVAVRVPLSLRPHDCVAHVGAVCGPSLLGIRG